jgi:hypothetical protein
MIIMLPWALFALHWLVSPSLELRPLSTVVFDSIALDCQVAPEVVATAEREKSGSDIRQAGDATKIVDPQKQAAEAMRQTAELAKQVMRHVVMVECPNHSPHDLFGLA